MDPNALTTGEWLAAHLDDPNVRILQVQFEPDVDDYSEGHIPGASYVFWKDLAWDAYERQFLTPAQMAERLGDLGVGPDTTLVLYAGRNHYAMYLYWILKEMAGHADVRVLDGSKKRWIMDGRPVCDRVSRSEPCRVPGASARARRFDARLPRRRAGQPGS